MSYYRKCPICDTKYDVDENDDICPYCDWFCMFKDYTGIEDEKIDNPITYNEAKKLLSQGLNIWGKPLPQK